MISIGSSFLARRSWCWPLTFMLAVTLAPTTARAIHPSEWVHTTEADFGPGETENVVVTNLGDVKLAHHAETLGEPLEEAGVIFDMQALADGTLYLAAGPEAKLLRRTDDGIEAVLELEDEQVFCLDVSADGRLLLGISGANSRLAVLDGDELRDLASLPGVLYVWDVVVAGPMIYVATGTDGRLLQVDLTDDAAPVVAQLLDTEQANLLCLGRDRAGRIYAGTDTEGLLYRVALAPNQPAPQPQPDDVEADADTDAAGDAEAGPPPLPKVPGTDVFVVYDAKEPEIGALLVMPDGTIYVGTADAEQARPGRLVKPATKETGRVETETEPEGGQDAPDAGADAEAPADQQAAPKPEAAAEAAERSEAPGPQPDAAEQAEDAADVAAADRDEVQPADAAGASPEQLEELRQITRQRLLEARSTGSLQVGSGGGAGRPTRTRAVQGRPSRSAQAPGKNGNAVYRISARGFVDEVFRESVMVLKLLDDNGRLLIATGNEGQVFSVDVDQQETALMVDLVPDQVPAMFRDRGEILLGTANPASLVRLGRGYADEGRYTSSVLDATQLSLWGQLSVTAKVPEGTTLAVQTRSGNVADPDQAPWSDWSEPTVLRPDPARPPLAPQFLRIASERARFLQYELTLTGSHRATPVVDRIDIAYVVPNLKPVIASLTATYPGQGGKSAKSSSSGSATGGKGGAAAPATKLKLEWAAADPNKDQLRYTLEYQLAGSDVWLTLDDEMTQNSYEWETRRVPNGRYTVRVTASDAADNPADMALTASRTSDPILVDNSPPALKDARLRAARADGGTVVTITTRAQDDLSPIRAVHYSVDGSELWQLALPADDLIYDSTSERIRIIIPDLAPGRHAITLRAIDGRGNATYLALFVDIE